MTADPAKIDRLNHALYPSLAMLAGMQLDVFSPLADGPMTTVELRQRWAWPGYGTHQCKDRNLFFFLLAGWLFEERPDTSW